MGLLVYFVGMRLQHFAIDCRDAEFTKLERVEALLVGSALITDFKTISVTTDANLLMCWGSSYSLLFLDVPRPWKASEMYLELLIGLLRCGSAGNHREVTVGDVLARRRRMQVMCKLTEIRGWDRCSLYGKKGYTDIKASGGEDVAALSGAESPDRAFEFISNVFSSYRPVFQRHGVWHNSPIVKTYKSSADVIGT